MIFCFFVSVELGSQTGESGRPYAPIGFLNLFRIRSISEERSERAELQKPVQTHRAGGRDLVLQ